MWYSFRGAGQGCQYDCWIQLKYANNKLGQWEKNIVFETAANQDIAINSKDRIRILYGSIRGMEYASLEEGTWKTELIDTEASGYGSLDLDFKDFAHVTYSHRSLEGDRLDLRYATNRPE